MDFSPIQVFSNYIDANIMRGRLEDEGIYCWLKDENIVTLDPILTNAIGGIKLMVRSEQVDRAFQLLKQFRSEIEAKIKCPRCGSPNIEYITTPRKASNWFGFLIGLFMTSYALSPDKVYHCFECGFEFEDVKEDDEAAMHS
jgi:DNA-directed RNA polymerase subunit RPC12/RpoP